MKLAIDKVAYGLTPYGADYGNHALAAYFKAVDGDYDYKKEELKHISDDEKEVALTDEDIAGYGLFDDLIQKCDEAGLSKELESYLLGNSTMYFIGDDFTADEYRTISMKFFEKLSYNSKDMQLVEIKRIAAERKMDEKSAIMHYIRAPYTVFAGSPINYTGVDQFYENFNYIVMKLNGCLKEPAPIACIEAQNHKFASFIIEADDSNIEEIKKDIEDNWVKGEIVRASNTKFFFVDTSDKPSEKVKEAANEKNWRLQRKLNYSGVLEF